MKMKTALLALIALTATAICQQSSAPGDIATDGTIAMHHHHVMESVAFAPRVQSIKIDAETLEKIIALLGIENKDGMEVFTINLRVVDSGTGKAIVTAVSK